MGRGDPLMRGGFASLSSGRGDNMVNFPGFVTMLQANSMPGYYPTMPNQEWLQHQRQQALNVPDPAYYPRLDDIPSTSANVDPDYELQDEEEEEEDNEEEGVAEEGNEADNISTPPRTRSNAVSKSSAKELAYIRPGTFDVLELSVLCARKITKTFEDTLHKEFLTWGSVTLEKKNDYFEEFKKGFTWPESEEDAIRRAWEKKATQQYAAITYKIRHSEKQPSFVLDAVWKEWNEQWDRPNFKRRSEKMKANRGRASAHTGGSRSFLNTADFLKEKYKKEILPHELFGYNHSKGHDLKTFVSSKAMSVDEAYKREIAAQKQANTLNGTPINEVDAYLKAAGGIKKSEVYGIGGQKKILYGSSCSSSSSQNNSGRSHKSEVEKLREELNRERIRSDERIESMQAQLHEMQILYQKLANPTSENALRDQEVGNDEDRT